MDRRVPRGLKGARRSEGRRAARRAPSIYGGTGGQKGDEWLGGRRTVRRALSGQKGAEWQ